jgi:putative membrane protein
MINKLILTLKGIAMGAANVVPGVSGGTIALITNIFEELINTLKSFDKEALRLLFKGNFIDFFQKINLKFLIPVFAGIIISIFSLAKIIEHLLETQPNNIWAYFFGLVLASVYYVGKKINKWNIPNILFLTLGIAIALCLSLLNPSPIENTNYFFIFICGVIGISGMILPGLSGSYILMLMGNYQLLMVKSVNSFFEFIKLVLSGQLDVFSQNAEMQNHLIYLTIFVLGSVIGIVAFSHLIALIFKKYKNITLALLTGFIFGSLATIWPWKNEVFDLNTLDINNQPLFIGYERYIPNNWNTPELIVVGCVFLGMISIIIIELLANKSSK